MSHAGGCYDAIGVINGKYVSSQRLGMNPNSWAVRVYGASGTSGDQIVSTSAFSLAFPMCIDGISHCFVKGCMA
jgi:hypothetical protein